MISDSDPPCAEAAEAAILSIAFDRPDQFIPKLRAQGVTKDTFWKWRKLAGEIFRFYDDNGTTETIAFHQDLITRNMFDACGGSTIFEIIGGCLHTAYGWAKWVEQIKECHALRLARQFHQSDDGYETSDDAENALEEALIAIRSAKTGASRAATSKEAAEAFLEEFMANRAAGEIPGKSTGIAEIDEISGGLRPGELWVICGPTSGGKSVLMLQMAAQVIEDGGKSAIFSLEMTKTEIIARLVSLVARVDFGKIMQPRKLTCSHDLKKVQAAVRKIGEQFFWIDDADNQTLDHIGAECSHLADEHGSLDLVMVDYLQIMSPVKGRGETREQEVAGFSRGLKQLAKRMRCPVVTGAQLTDEGRLRESRGIGMDANSVLTIGDDGVVIGKMRNGRKGQVIPIYLNGALQRFTNIRPRKEE